MENTSQEMKGAIRQLVEAFADAIIERVPGFFKIAQWLPVGFFLGGSQTGRAGVENVFARTMREWERLKKITTATLKATAFFSVLGILLYAVSFMFELPLLAVTGGILVTIAIITIFLYLYLIQEVVRLIKNEGKLNGIDPTTEEGKEYIKQLDYEKKKLAGMFAKGIMWICIYLFFAVRLEPWTDLTLFFSFNLSLFILLLLKKASHMGRKGLKTLGDYAEWALLASFTVYFIGSLSFYWISGFERAGIDGPKDFVTESSDAMGNFIMWPVNGLSDFNDDTKLAREHRKVIRAASDLNGDGFTDRLDTALMIADMNGDNKVSWEDTTAWKSCWDDDLETWRCFDYVQYNGQSQLRGDFNADLEVDLWDFELLVKFLKEEGVPPTLVQIPSWEDNAMAIDPDESMEYGQAEALDSGQTFNSVRTVSVGTPLSGTESYFTLIVDEVDLSPEVTIVTITWSDPRGNKDRATVGKRTQIRFAQGKYYVNKVVGLDKQWNWIRSWKPQTAQLYFPALPTGTKYFDIIVHNYWTSSFKARIIV